LGLIRFSHTVFALPFALLAAAMAWSRPDSPFEWRQLVGVLLCMVFARSAAMAFNRLVDRDIDAANPRTQSRHLPAGILSVPTVWAFTMLCGVGFVASTLLFLPNWWPLVLSGPVLAFLCGYSYAKRFTAWCHYWLAAALMLSPIAAWLAIRGVVELPPVLLAGVIFFWVGGFDILYACQDADFDRERRLNSLPARLGVAGALRMAFVSHLLAIGGMFAVWAYGDFGPIFLTGVIGVSVLLLLEHSLVRADNLSRVNLAFFHMNAVISLGLLAVGLLDLWWQ
jgi:4-hydroxybenzoate polyprenyltransferase